METECVSLRERGRELPFYHFKGSQAKTVLNSRGLGLHAERSWLTNTTGPLSSSQCCVWRVQWHLLPLLHIYPGLPTRQLAQGFWVSSKVPQTTQRNVFYWFSFKFLVATSTFDLCVSEQIEAVFVRHQRLTTILFWSCHPCVPWLLTKTT